MLIAQSWLQGLLGHDTPGWQVSPEDLDAGFVRVGFETEGYAPIPSTTGPLVIGRVLEIEELTGFKKPIRYCQVDVGSANGTGEPQGIVCGARNFAVGDYVVVSLPGAELPGGFKIAARKTYDHISNGMMCSAAELGLADKQTKGIITLSEDFGAPGDPAAPALGLDDTIFDVNVTPDRGYALSARGLAREIASAFDLPFTDPAAHPAAAGIDVSGVPAEITGDAVAVEVDPATRTRRFGMRRVTGVNPTVESPFWLQRELLACGQRPVNAATDVTNFVMLLLGQPMHAFDATAVTGSLRIRQAAAGETLETIDHVSRTLDPEDVVIADESRVLSIAGVMGGAASEIGDDTTDILFEAANWDPIFIARSCRRHKLSSEASRRFERGVDPALVEVALDVAAALLVQIAGGTVEPVRTLIGEVPAPAPIDMAAGFPSEIAGVEYGQETVVRRLEEVGCTVEANGTQLRVTPPTWRSDLTVPVELVEEVLRLEGLAAIPLELPTPTGGRGLTEEQKRRRAVGHALAYSGYAEILPTPFIKQDTFDQWGLAADDPRRNVVHVQNPLESDHAVLATTLLPAMLEAVARNVARGRRDLTIFGLQQVSFRRASVSPMPSTAARPSDEEIAELIESLPEQPLHVATVGVGNVEHEGPWGEGVAYTWADAIESARVVARAAGVELGVAAAEQLPWHPGRCAALMVADAVVGYAGELHPEVLERVGLPPRTCAMELDLTALPLETELPAPVLSAFPALHQDIALVVDESVPAETVRTTLVRGAGELLESVELFDVYRSDSLGSDKKSLAFQLLFRAADRTLTDDEASAAREAAAALAAAELGAQMRA